MKKVKELTFEELSLCLGEIFYRQIKGMVCTRSVVLQLSADEGPQVFFCYRKRGTAKSVILFFNPQSLKWGIYKRELPVLPQQMLPQVVKGDFHTCQFGTDGLLLTLVNQDAVIRDVKNAITLARTVCLLSDFSKLQKLFWTKAKLSPQLRKDENGHGYYTVSMGWDFGWILKVGGGCEWLNCRFSEVGGGLGVVAGICPGGLGVIL